MNNSIETQMLEFEAKKQIVGELSRSSNLCGAKWTVDVQMKGRNLIRWLFISLHLCYQANWVAPNICFALQWTTHHAYQPPATHSLHLSPIPAGSICSFYFSFFLFVCFLQSPTSLCLLSPLHPLSCSCPSDLHQSSTDPSLTLLPPLHSQSWCRALTQHINNSIPATNAARTEFLQHFVFCSWFPGQHSLV